MAPHPLRASTEAFASGGRASVAWNYWESLYRRRAREREQHIIGLEQLESRDGREQTSSLPAIDLVTKQMAFHGAFLYSILALATDQYAVLCIILEQVIRAESRRHVTMMWASRLRMRPT